MCKKYQYLYLKEKINHQFTNNQLYEETTEHWDSIGTGMSSEHRDYADEQSIKIHVRTTHLSDWLNKINKKHNYIGENNAA
tara:strand:- start:186 stop:428 length:243 start_codon:yes stop_codon:yes gene_type:complete